MRNIQKNLIPKWKTSNKVSQLIDELPDFCNNYEFQIKEGLLPDIGEYSINSYKYDINDFFRNQNNKCFKILILNEDEEGDKKIFSNRFFVITSTSFIILKSVDEKFKNICEINYVGDLCEIEGIDEFSKEGVEYKDLVCFKIEWKKTYRNQLVSTMYGDAKQSVVKNIYDCLTKRKEKLLSVFKFIQKSESANIKIYEEIIKIKEKLVEKKTNGAIFDEINNLYQQIIEVLSSFNGEDFKKYIEKLQKFINSYEKLNAEENKKKESLKNKNNDNKNGANTE